MDALEGQVYWAFSHAIELNVAEPEYRLDSTLIVVASCPPPEMYGYKNCNREYYTWNGSHLILLKTEPVTGAD